MVKFFPLAIGTPFYNSEPHLNEYFNAILSLNYSKKLLTLVFADNGSTDKTFERFEAFANEHNYKYNKIIVLSVDRVKEGNNLANVRRRIVEESDPLDLIFIDADTVAPPHAIRCLLKNTDIGDIIGGITITTTPVPILIVQFLTLTKMDKDLVYFLIII